jgi:hypothetical protein
MVGDQAEFVPDGVEHAAGAEHRVMATQHVHEVHPVLDEAGVDLAGCCGGGRGVEAQGGPDACAKEAPTAEGIHVFSRVVQGRPAYRDGVPE